MTFVDDPDLDPEIEIDVVLYHPLVARPRIPRIQKKSLQSEAEAEAEADQEIVAQEAVVDLVEAASMIVEFLLVYM